MSKPASRLFHGTKGELALYGNAEATIASRVAGLDLREHSTPYKQLSTKQRRSIAQKIKQRTATAEEYKRYMWDKRFGKRRRAGVKSFWKQERNRLELGKQGTRRWTDEQRAAILSGKAVKFEGKTLQGHHTYSASKYPHLANQGAVIYPATHTEHLKGWHGGSYKNNKPGQRIRPINEF